MKYLEIIVPVKDEAKNVEELVKRIDAALNSANIEYGITFVDDHSSDGTTRILKRLAKVYPVKFFTKRGKEGKAYSILEGVEQSKAEYIAMIDGDLQYAPEILPEMFKKLERNGVVVAKRKIFKVSPIRKLMSKTFSLAFGKLLFGIKADVQSGLKVFRKEILSYIDPKEVSPWTLDLPLLHTALELGYTIGEVDMDFKERKNGESKINLLESIFEIGTQSLKLKLKRKKIYSIDPDNENTMRGAGVVFKRKRFITHTSLEHHKSAIRTFYPWQKGVFFLIILNFVLGLVLNFLLTLQITIAILSLIYFVDVLFNLYLILKSLHSPPEIIFTDSQLEAIDESRLPVYSILCPLYREAQVIPHFIEAISKLDWPKNKLDVQLLLEEDDVESVEAVKNMELPFYVKVNIVPESMPKTKPKACNFGLMEAIGEYVVIYDAEDIPEPFQLKKAYLAFKKSKSKVICMQAKLNYFNPHQNLLTKFFTAEYSLWFDVILPGFQSIGTNIPLGGTSNHFKKQALMKIEGWDPFNVTEDCDLGIRLFMDGYQTAVIDSTTLEEANSNFKNWIRQRSRWIKGYMQTYLVHMRNPGKLFKEQGWHFLIFQLVIGARVIFGLVNPILWAITISYFTMRAFVGPSIEALYPSYVFYPAVFSLVFGNFSYLYYYMIGSAKREHYGVIKYVFLIPLYWVMWSIASFMALYQLITKPHFWEKTVHGLHLKKEQVVEVVSGISIADKKSFPVKVREKLEGLIGQKEIALGGLMLVGANMIANLSNFAFNAYFGRKLTLEDYGLLSLFTSIYFISSIVLGGLISTISHKVAYLLGKFSKEKSKGYFNHFNRYLLVSSITATIFWIVLIPVLAKFFNSPSLLPFILFTPVWTIGLFYANMSGYLSGTLSFGKVAVLVIAEAFTKLILTWALFHFGLLDLAVLVIPVSILIPAVLSYLLIFKDKSEQLNKNEGSFDWLFYSSSVLIGVSTISFFGLDLILAKHYLNPSEAGQYGLLSLVGKISFFLSSLFLQFIIPVVSKNEGQQKDSKRIFGFIFGITAFLSMSSTLVFILFGNKLVPILFGEKAVAIIPYILIYMSSVCLFTIARPVISYFQAKKNYSFALAGFITFIAQVWLINVFHSSLQEFVLMMLLVSGLNLFLIVMLYLFKGYVQITVDNLNDLAGLIFSKIKFNGNGESNSARRILIFNWRDTKHVWAGGAESYIYEIAKRWVKEGNEVTVFCGNDSNNLRRETIDGVQIVRRGGSYTVYVWAFLYYVLRFRGRFDLIIDSANGIPFFTPLYAGIPKFLLIHHIHQEVFSEHLIWPFSAIAKLIESKLMPIVYKNQRIITVSQSSKNDILKIKLSKGDLIDIVNPGVNLKVFSKGRKTKFPSFLYLGRLKPYKNIDTIIKAFEEVSKKYPKATLSIAGFGESFKKLKKLTEDLGIKNSIDFLGRVSDERKAKLYAKSWVVLQPSMIEGWGITVIEANASGTPVIASNVNGLRDSVINCKTGILVQSKNVKGFAQAMIKLVKDKKLKAYLSEQAFEWSQNFAWDTQAKSFYNILENSFAADRKLSLGELVFTERRIRKLEQSSS